MSKKSTPAQRPVVQFHEPFHWEIHGGSLTFWPAEIEVDQDVADAAVSLGFAELIEGEAKPFLPAPADEIEDAE